MFSIGYLFNLAYNRLTGSIVPSESDTQQLQLALHDLNQTYIDDRSLAIQRVVRFLSDTKSDSKASIRVRDEIIKILHFHGERAFQFSRVIPSEKSENRDSKELELLKLRRQCLGPEHENQVSALADAYWTLISLCLYPRDVTSSFSAKRSFDLSPLYGLDESSGRPIRQVDGRGLLRPDRFYEASVAPFQATLAALLIMWNRNHNYIAHNLFIRFASTKKWKYPVTNAQSKERLDNAIYAQDTLIYTAARHINLAQFRNTICEDVLKGLLLPLDADSNIRLDILKDISGVSKGKGQEPPQSPAQTFKEAYFLYPINPMMCKSDAEFQEDIMVKIGASSTSFSAKDLRKSYLSGVQKVKDEVENIIDYPCLSRKSIYRWVESSSSSLTRTVDAQLQNVEFYKNEDILMKARIEAAGPPGGFTHSYMYTRMIELEALQQQQDENFCTFNTFRILHGLDPLPTFNVWNPDPLIWREAERIYGKIDNLSLYVGLQCEASVPATGFGFGYTKTYALLVDLVTLLRTPNWQPALDKLEDVFSRSGTEDPLSSWVSNELKFKWSAGYNDTFLPKILQRNFSMHFPPTNAHSFFLFSTPSTFSKNNWIKKRPLDIKKPKFSRIHIVTDLQICSEVFKSDSRSFLTLYSEQLELLTNDYGYLLGFDAWHKDPCSHHAELEKRVNGARCQGDLHITDRKLTMFALIPDKRGSLGRYGRLFGQLTEDYIAQRSREQLNKTCHVDLIADVINNVCTRWVCETLCDYELGDDISGKLISLAGNQKTTKEMYQEFANLSIYIFKMFGHADLLEAQRTALRSSEYLRTHIEQRIPKPDWLDTSLNFQQRAVQIQKSLYRPLRELAKTWFGGGELSAQTAQSFLRRAVQANQLLPLPKDEFVPLMQEKINQKGDLKKGISASNVDEIEEDIEVSRVVANVLGLAAVAAVNIPQVCSTVIAFYLDAKYEKHRSEIIDISKPVHESEAEREEQNRKLSPYILEALRIRQPLGLWRKAREDIKLSNNVEVKQGDLLFADFHHFHNREGDFPDPEQVNTSFIDHVIPEVIKAIFRLPGLSYADEVTGRVMEGIDPLPHIANPTMHPRLYISEKGETSYYPQTLLVKFTPSSKDDKSVNLLELEEQLSSTHRWIIGLSEYFVGTATVIWTSYKLFAVLYAMFAVALLGVGIGTRTPKAFKLPHMSEVQTLSVDCPLPTTIWEDWSPYTMTGGPEGVPLDIIFNFSFPVSHQLQVYDADKKDTKLAIYVDDTLRALSTDFELDKAIDCGDNPYQCYVHQFSFGTLVVPPGDHLVRISWAGKELSNGTYPDLGKNSSRRILVKRDHCAPQAS